MGRALAAALLVAAIAAASAGCSSSSDDANGPSTAAERSTTTTEPEITDDEIIANINEKLKPALETEYDADQVTCILGVLQDGGTGELSADAVVPAYEERCGVTSTEVTGVITASALVDQGADQEAADCVAHEIAAQTYEQISALGEEGTNALYESCGIDVDALTGG
jgi:hypothetical protein